MQKSHVSNIELSMEHWEQGVQEDQKKPNKQTNPQNKQTKNPPKNKTKTKHR